MRDGRTLRPLAETVPWAGDRIEIHVSEDADARRQRQNDDPERAAAGAERGEGGVWNNCELLN